MTYCDFHDLLVIRIYLHQKIYLRFHDLLDFRYYSILITYLHFYVLLQNTGVIRTCEFDVISIMINLANFTHLFAYSYGFVLAINYCEFTVTCLPNYLRFPNFLAKSEDLIAILTNYFPI